MQICVLWFMFYWYIYVCFLQRRFVKGEKDCTGRGFFAKINMYVHYPFLYLIAVVHIVIA